MSELSLADWRMLQLVVDDLGPFRQGAQTFSFLGETPPLGVDHDAGPPGPSNLYMLIAPNARGKTTVLEAIYGLFGLLASEPRGRFSDATLGGKAQLDVRATWTIDGAVETVLLSIWTGSNEPLHFWSDDDLENVAQAGRWARLGIGRNPSGPFPLDETDELGRIFFSTVRNAAGIATQDLPSRAQNLPTVIYFPADRSIVAPQTRRLVAPPANWGYEPAYRFSHDGPSWESSIDNLLVWLEWLEQDQLEEVLRRVNEYVFEADSSKTIVAPRRSDLTTYVSTVTGAHPISALSHGERALLQMFTRIFSHMTLNTVLLIDEIELHLHTRWMNRMYRSLRSILADTPALSLVFTTHDRELIEVFDYERPERNLTKGGYLILDEMA